MSARSTLGVPMLALLSSCGAGTAAVVSGTGGGSSQNSAPVLAELVVEGGKVSPATVRFTVVDQEGDPAQVRLYYSVPGEAPRAVTQLTGVGVTGNAVSAASSPEGVQHALTWDFSAEALLLPAAGGYVEGATLFAEVEGGVQGVLAGANADTDGLGNDPPVVQPFAPSAGEVTGVVPIGLFVSDSSGDVVSLSLEFDVEGDAPDLGWRPATPSSAFPGGSSEFSIDGLEASPGGTQVTFFWDTDADLLRTEADVRLRARGVDRGPGGELLSTGAFLESGLVHVDNNAAPLLTLQADVLQASGDRRLGIPLSYTLSDPESDEIAVVFQWRREGETFPELPADPHALDAVLADPKERARHRICSEYPAAEVGRIAVLDDLHVRLPELSGPYNHLVWRGVIGRDLEILRPGLVPRPIAHEWSASPLQRPVACLPAADPTEALVLDAPAGGGWRLLRVVLATGEVRAELASAPGATPTALAAERFESSVLVASEQAGAWVVDRVELATGAVRTLIAQSGSAPSGPIRALASLGRNAAVAAIGDRLVRLGFVEGYAPSVGVLASDLGEVTGVIVDPVDPGRLYACALPRAGEGPHGRVLRLTLLDGRLEVLELDTSELSTTGIGGPRALAATQRGDRLVLVGELVSGLGSLLLEVTPRPGARAQVVPFSRELLEEELSSIATGPDRLLLAAAPDKGELLVGGGVEQVRRVTELDVATCTVSVGAPFAPALRPGQRWRLGSGVARPAESGGAGPRTFVWDSADAGGYGDVFLRGTPRDADLGASDELSVALSLAPRFVAQESPISGPGLDAGADFALADLDGDGDDDLFCPRSNGTLEVYQRLPQGFLGPGEVLVGQQGALDGRVRAGDFDGDGLVDLACTYSESVPPLFGSTINLFRQSAPWRWESSGVALEDEVNYAALRASCDMNRDGLRDMLVTHEVSEHAVSYGHLFVWQQQRSGGLPGATSEVGLPPAGYLLSDAIALDVDLDGRTDVLTYSSWYPGAQSSVLMCFAREPGSFDPPVPLPVGFNLLNGLGSLLPADLDSDGDLDFLVTGNAQGEAFYVLQEAPRHFSAPVPVDLSRDGVSAAQVFLADLDRDGTVDCVTTHGSGREVAVFPGQPGSAIPRRAARLLGPGETPELLGLGVSDDNGDGRLDVVMRAESTQAFFLQVFRDTIDRRFHGASTTVAPGENPNLRSFAIADVNSDGRQDLVALSRSESNYVQTWDVYLRDVLGEYSLGPQSFTSLSGNQLPEALILGDFDGDGRVDLLSYHLATNNSGRIKLVLQGATGLFDSPTQVLYQGPLGSVAAGDHDLDGRLDILFSFNAWPFPIGTGVSALHMSERGVWSESVILPFEGPSLPSANEIELVDLDQDSNPELVGVAASYLFLVEGLAPGEFATTPEIRDLSATLLAPLHLEVADLNADGRPDLIVAAEGSDRIGVLFQDAAGGFPEDPVLLGGPQQTPQPSSVQACDLDGDGLVDLLCQTAAGPRVLRTTWPGSFALTEELPDALTSGTPVGVQAMDLDGDGDHDVLVTGTGAGDLRVLHGGR